MAGKTVLGITLLFVAPTFGQDVQAGAKVYASFCANCHGAHGLGARGPSLSGRGLPRAPDDGSLARVVLRGIAGTEMPPTRLSEREVRDLVVYVRSLARETPPEVTGNAGNGKKLYQSNGCAQCHMIHGEGGRLGPDLTEIGRSRSAAYLRRALLEPGADVPEHFARYRVIITLPDNFLLVRAVTREGESVTGVRLNEDPFTIQIRDFSDRFHSFDKGDLEKLEKDYGSSPMPGYNTLTESEIDDMVAYMVSLRGAPAQ